jgi:tRNA-(ms[2]io[6]A)-hydroxylase
MADPKRRLPVLKSEAPPDEDERPPWHWVGFGTLAIFAAWLPLAYLATAAETRIVSRFAEASSPEAIADAIAHASPHDVARLKLAIVLLIALPLALGAFGGGFIVGRWSRRAGVREAALSGLATSILTCALSWGSLGGGAPATAVLLTSAALTIVAVAMAALGGWYGAQARAKAQGGAAS